MWQNLCLEVIHCLGQNLFSSRRTSSPSARVAAIMQQKNFKKMSTLKHPLYSLETSLKPLKNVRETLWTLPWSPLESPLKLVGKDLETYLDNPWNNLEVPLKLPWKTIETSLNHHLRNNLETPLKLPWNTLKTLLKSLLTSLKLAWISFFVKQNVFHKWWKINKCSILEIFCFSLWRFWIQTAKLPCKFFN